MRVRGWGGEWFFAAWRATVEEMKPRADKAALSVTYSVADCDLE
jgi:hypothetical protein